MTDELLPALPKAAACIHKEALNYPAGMDEYLVWDADLASENDELIYTADQMRAYAREAIRLAQRDAARYRFIRGMSWGARMDEDGPLATLHDEELDNAIDAAMQPSPPAGEVA